MSRIVAVRPEKPCPTCNVIIKFHQRCADCGILAGWGHEQLRREPHGECMVCEGCYQALKRYGRKVKVPALGYGAYTVEGCECKARAG